MKRLLCLLSTVAIVTSISSSCDEAKDSASLSATSVKLAADEGETSLSVHANGTWVISSSESWLTLSPAYGADDDVVIATYAENVKEEERQATVTLQCGTASSAITFTQSARAGSSDAPGSEDDTADEANKNANDPKTCAEASRLEMPAFNADNYFVSHYATVAGVKEVNYSLEWNNDMKHAQWVAFIFDKDNCAKNVQRSDDFVADPDLPTNMQVDNSFHTNDGFDRGHLCASYDRAYSTETNKQTFYFSNMSPQLNEFNAGIWMTLENEVQSWGSLTSTGKYDTVYVAKGGTLNYLLKNFTGTKGQDNVIPTTTAEGFTVKGLACPAYYFMAILARKADAYSAIGFIIPHAQNLKPIAGGSQFTVADIKNYAVSIDELEEKTGLDFFCNLPDKTEDEIESELDLDAWKW